MKWTGAHGHGADRLTRPFIVDYHLDIRPHLLKHIQKAGPGRVEQQAVDGNRTTSKETCAKQERRRRRIAGNLDVQRTKASPAARFQLQVGTFTIRTETERDTEVLKQPLCMVS
jgi:hypothetical protein